MKHVPVARILEKLQVSGDVRSATVAAALADFPRVAGVVRKKVNHVAPDFVALAREEAKEEARAEYEVLRKQDAERFSVQLAEERQKWVTAESEKLVLQIDEGLRKIEGEVATVVARLLKPVLTEHAAKAAIDNLGTTLKQLSMQRPGVTFRISGPADLLDRLRERFTDLAGAEFVVDQSADIRVEADQTIIETCLAPWAAKLAEETA